MWPDGRVAEAIPTAQATGERWLCGASCCDEGHVAWGCSKVQEHPDVVALDDADLQRQCLDEASAQPAKWVRDLGPDPFAL
eukprot:8074132-Lingulodinium_polyedra.AAC.1